MNSAFKVRDGWCESPYDIGLAHYVVNNDSSVIKDQSSSGHSKRSSSSNNFHDESRILVQPILYARRFDEGILSSQVERLSVEPHLLYVTSELVTSQLLAREEKLREKRQQKLQVIADSKEDVEERLSIAETTTTTITTSLKRKQLQGKVERVKRLKVSDNPTVQTQQLIPATPTHQLSQLQQQQSDTVLVRLTSGQIFRISRQVLSAISNRTVSAANPRTASVTSCQGDVNDTKPRLAGSARAADLPLNVSLSRALEIIRGKYSGEEEVVNSDQTMAAGKTNGLLKQLTNFSASNANTSGSVKIRAYQGPPSSPTGVSSVPSTSSLSEQLKKIQQMPPTLALPPPTALQIFASQQPQPHLQQQTPTVSSGSHFQVTRIVQRQQRSGRPNVVMSAPVPVTQIRQSPQQFVMANGVHPSPIQQSPQGPMKIFFIHSPRKADGTPLSPGSGTPGIRVMNPPSNMGQIDLNEMLKAISRQNAATTAANAAKLQQSPQQSSA